MPLEIDLDMNLDVFLVVIAGHCMIFGCFIEKRELVIVSLKLKWKSLSKIQAIWGPTCGNKRPIKGQLCTNWPKIVRFSNFYRKENYRQFIGPQPKSSDFQRIFLSGLSKLVSTRPEEHHGRNKFSKKNYKLCPKLNETFSDFRRKIFGRVVKTAF